MKKYNIWFLIIMCLGITIQDSFGYYDIGYNNIRRFGGTPGVGSGSYSANDSSSSSLSRKSSSIRNDQPKKTFEIVNRQAMRNNEYLVSWKFPRRGDGNIYGEFHLGTCDDDGYFHESLYFQDLSNGLNEKEKIDYFKENIVLVLGIYYHDEYDIKGSDNINMFLKDVEKLYYTMEKWISIAKSKNLTHFEKVYDNITFKVGKASYRKTKKEEVVLKVKFKVKKSSQGEVHYTTVIYEEDKRYANVRNVVITELDLAGVKNLADMKSMNEFLALLYNKVKVIDDANRSWK